MEHHLFLGLCPTDFKFASPNDHMSRFLKINLSIHRHPTGSVFLGKPLLNRSFYPFYLCVHFCDYVDHAVLRSSMIAPYPFSTSGAALLLTHRPASAPLCLSVSLTSLVLSSLCFLAIHLPVLVDSFVLPT